MLLALYCFAAGQPAAVLRLLGRARYLSLLLSGEDHPQLVQLDVSIRLWLRTLAPQCFKGPMLRGHR